MKKIIITFIIIFSFIPFITKKNDYKDISNIVYVSSIGLDYDNVTNEYIIYYYILNNFNLTSAQISSSNIDDLSYTVKVQEKNFAEAFSSIKKKINNSINYTHLNTIILSRNFIGKDHLLHLYHYIRDLTSIYLDFYIFTTDSEIEDLYNIRNFSDVSAYHTILVTPNLIKTYKLITFVHFAKLILKPNYTLLIPHLTSVMDTFSKQDSDFLSLEIDGYSILKNDFSYKTYLAKDYPQLLLLINLQDQTFSIDEYELYLKDGKYKIKKLNNDILIYYKIYAVINLNPNDENLVNIKEKLEPKIQTIIKDLINATKQDNIDIFNINYIIGPESLTNKKIKIIVDLDLN